MIAGKKHSPSSFKGWRGMTLPIILFILSLFIWQSAIIRPVKYLTVFFHELSHGMAAIMTGGQIVRIELNANTGGLCVSRGGNRFIIVSAGYLGSLIWGCLILALASKTDFDREITAALGILLLIVTALWVRNLAGVLICVLTGLSLIAIAKYLSNNFCDQFLKYFGLTSCFYVIIDMKDHLVYRTIQGSDAYVMGQMLGISDRIVGGVWLVIATIVTWKVLSYCLNEK